MTNDHRSHSSPSEEVLRQLIDETRRDVAPGLDWDAAEARLLSRVAEKGFAPRGGQRRPQWLDPAALAAVTAVAAATALVVQTSAPDRVDPGETATAPSRPDLRHGENVDGDALSPGALIASEATAIVVEHVDHVTWTLAPGGLARVESVGDVIALSLDRGSVSARVTKAERPESFVVRVEKSRIAVHGTAFRVDRLEKSVHVEVTEGVVAIGPLGGGAFELRAPGSVEVSFDGARREAVRRSTPAAAVGPGAAPASEPVPASEPESAPNDTAANAGPGPGEAPGVERVIQAVRRCLSEHTVAGGDLRVSVRTRLSLKVQATGHVGEVLFDPPLAPPVQACVGAHVGSIGFAASHDGFALERVIELER